MNKLVAAYNSLVIVQVADKFIKFMSGKKPENCKLIVSSHNYDNTPSAEELASLLAQIQATGADIVKIATTATEIVDVSRMFQILVHCQVSLLSNSKQAQHILVLAVAIFRVYSIGPQGCCIYLI